MSECFQDVVQKNTGYNLYILKLQHLEEDFMFSEECFSRTTHVYSYNIMSYGDFTPQFCGNYRLKVVAMGRRYENSVEQ